jgi:WD40 repeat protein
MNTSLLCVAALGLPFLSGCEKRSAESNPSVAETKAPESHSAAGVSPAAPAGSVVSADSSLPRAPTFDKPPAPIDKFKFGLAQVKYFPDGRRFLTAGQATPVRIWSVAAGSVQLEVEPARTDNERIPVTVLRDGSVLTCRDGMLRQYDPDSGELRGALLEKTRCGDSLFASPSGEFVGWLDSIGVLHLYNLAARTEKTKPSALTYAAALGFSPDSQRFCTRSWTSEKPFPRSAVSLEALHSLEIDEPCNVGGFAVTSDGRWIASGGGVSRGAGMEAGRVHVKHPGSREAEHTLKFHFLGPQWVGFVDHERILLAIGGNSKQGMVRGWSTSDWKEEFTVKTDAEPNAFDISPDSTVLLWGGYGGRLRFLDVRTGAELARIDTCCTQLQ